MSLSSHLVVIRLPDGRTTTSTRTTTNVNQALNLALHDAATDFHIQDVESLRVADLQEVYGPDLPEIHSAWGISQ